MKKRKKLVNKTYPLKNIDYAEAVASATSFAVENIKVKPEVIKRKKELELKYPETDQ